MAPRVSVPRHPPNRLTPDLRVRLISGLLSSGAIQNLNSTLLSSCQVTGWLDAVRDRAIQLLRSGECSTYEQVMAALQEESKGRGIEKTAAEKRANGYSNRALANGGQASDGEREGAERDWREYDTDDGRVKEKRVDVTMPKKVIEDGKKFVKEALDQIVVIEDSE